ncbi:uncharacterized protein LOC107368700 [Tetranychus urticae]|uniref:Uncharacterized protein n=1 Tax=Tetranychus urticae TaxID=32264 RepID=T1KZK2_TETUR|nr:uncharacterized protein LOC107368700 [Tetranychus urticae]
MFKMKTITATVLLALTLSMKVSAQNETYCKAIGDELDSLMKDVLHMKPDPLFPNSTENRELFCGPSKELLKKANLYVKCLPRFQAQVVSIMSKGTRKPVKLICNGDGEKIIKTYSCMDAKFKESLHKQEAIFLNSLIVIKEKVPQDKLHSSFCCTARNISESLLVTLPKLKCEDPTIDLPKHFTSLIETSLGDTLDLICGSFPSFDVCKEKAAESVKLLEENFSDMVDTKETPLVGSVLQIIGKLAN